MRRMQRSSICAGGLENLLSVSCWNLALRGDYPLGQPPDSKEYLKLLVNTQSGFSVCWAGSFAAMAAAEAPHPEHRRGVKFYCREAR